ncbi:proline--tRNA ligase [Neofamilia massiliensis]|uniref:proline--tRNA ligase n=1 Tax=Neofamilia massiliensis TaxID=1673724 RepID=UPI0006BB83AD|nr:proline--tRNA ligase [Neofamilia massiliensis]
MRLSKLYMPTLREVPSDAEIASHQLLLRAGMIRLNVSGIYSYLPLGYRVIRKIEEINREEMDRAGSQECHLSAVQSREMWEESGRWATFGPEMFKLKDRNSREFCLGPTHEEYFTTLVRDEIRSYKQLPLSLYQIQTKYRDEKRPRFGVIRAREFIMKDAYSFDKDKEGMEESYKNMWQAYEKIFERMNLDYTIVQGDSGAMGGNNSHEFIALSEYGEGVIAYSRDSNYAATDEKAQVILDVDESGEEEELEEVHTPGITTIDDLADFLKIEKSKLAKMVIYETFVDGKKEALIALIPGHRQLNETKFFNACKVNDFDVQVASDETIKEITGAEPGFSGPLGLKGEFKLFIDERLTRMKNLVVGANKTDYHIKNANYGRDFDGVVVDDLLLVEEGDKDPLSDGILHLDRGIEVGNIFQLGTKYSKALGFTYLDEDGKDQDVYMGSYGVGVSRCLAAIVEQHHDEDGIIWPMSVAAYELIITIVNPKDETQKNLGEKLYKEFSDLGVETLLDDRKERPGVKFKDRDLIGIPLRITVGKNAGENIVEFSTRREKANENVNTAEIIEKILNKIKAC